MLQASSTNAYNLTHACLAVEDPDEMATMLRNNLGKRFGDNLAKRARHIRFLRGSSNIAVRTQQQAEAGTYPAQVELDAAINAFHRFVHVKLASIRLNEALDRLRAEPVGTQRSAATRRIQRVQDPLAQRLRICERDLNQRIITLRQTIEGHRAPEPATLDTERDNPISGETQLIVQTCIAEAVLTLDEIAA